MAKSLRFKEYGGRRLTADALPPFYWEHWFDIQAAASAANLNPKGRNIWEKAVSFEILAAKRAKR